MDRDDASHHRLIQEDPTTCQFKLDVDPSYHCSEPPSQDALCIFHAKKLTGAEKRALSRIDQKTVREGEILFQGKLKELIQLNEAAPDYDKIDLRGFHFPAVNFPKVISKRLDLTRAIFNEVSSFENTEFKEGACFQMAIFLADVSFQGAIFRKKADFYIASFGPKGTDTRTSFLSATFDEGANFTAASFSGLAQFSGTAFGEGGSAIFQNTTFGDEAVFFDSVFATQTIFQATFHGESFFDRSVFNSQARFAGSTFNKRAQFYKAKFKFPDFSKAVFKDSASFMEVQFFDSADFTQCIFDGQVDFGGSSFRHVNFCLSEFRQQASFFRSVFQSTGLFRFCKFSGETTFLWAVFNDDVDFSAATFTLLVEFSDCVFDGSVNFLSASFVAEARFVNTEGKGCFAGEADFRHLNRGKRVSLIFKSVNLAKARFINTDLGGAAFSNIQWLRQAHKLAPWTSRPASLWDEFRSPRDLKVDDYEAIAENYRQLVLNYEEKRDYESAESFHIGEMEMRRKKKAAGIEHLTLRRIREWANSYGVYRASNHYGTSYGQALVTLLILLVMFSFAFLYSGFRTVEDPKRIIEYDVFAGSGHHRVGKEAWLNDFLAATSLSSSILTFQQDRFYEPLEGVSRLWLFLAVIVLTAQAAMILLATRRRFKR